MNDVEELYQELIVDHYKNPRGRGVIDDPDAKCTLFNPLCGDEVTLYVCVEDGTIKDLQFSGRGCAISQASASMMSEVCEGVTVEQARHRLATFTTMMKSELPEEELEPLGDAASLQGVRRFAARIRCATLGWEALAKCLSELSESSGEGE